MPYNPAIHHRRSVRLRGYDYTQSGAYFVTLVTQWRACLFGEIVAGEMVLNPLGESVREEWLRSAEIRRELGLDTFIVMPNHLHGIVVIVGPAGADPPLASSTNAVGAHGRAPLPGNSPPLDDAPQPGHSRSPAGADPPLASSTNAVGAHGRAPSPDVKPRPQGF